MSQNNDKKVVSSPECKKCGLLLSTVEATGKKCVRGQSHEWETPDITSYEEDIRRGVDVHGNDKKVEGECIFCEIAEKSDDTIVDIEPLNPVVKGHRIVFAKYHSLDFTDDKEITLMVMRRAIEVAKMNGGDYNLITSKGRAATQSVFHLHVHLVPRKEGDGLALPWTDQLSVSQETALRKRIELEVKESLKNDYKNWVRAGNADNYKGETPFWKWRNDVEAESMKHWD